MGRSVSTPSNAVAVMYVHLDYDDNWLTAHDEFSDDVENLRAAVREHLEMHDSNVWLDRENRVILHDEYGQVGISEYCGLIAIWAVPSESDDELASAFEHANWIDGIEAILESATRDAFGDNILRKVGTFSNGESVYERVGP